MRQPKTDLSPRPNSVIELGKEKIRFTLKGKTVSRTARIRIALLPSPTLRLEINLGRLADKKWIFLDDIGPEAVLVESNTAFRVFGLRVKGRQLILAPARVPIRMKVDPAVEVRRIRFQLFNFPDFSCLGQDGSDLRLSDENTGEHRRVGSLDLRAAGWRIIIAGDMTTKDIVATLKEKGGYGATQNGEISRSDGSVFPSSEGEIVLSCLHSFLSFARGQWVCPGLAVSDDEQGEVVWREWGLGRLDPWAQPRSWFDTDHGEILAQVFPGFYGLWSSDLWHRILRDCLYWYLRSNGLSRGAGPDGGLILTLPALELLSWIYLVQDEKRLSKSEFRGLGAKDRMRRLLQELDGALRNDPLSKIDDRVELPEQPLCGLQADENRGLLLRILSAALEVANGSTRKTAAFALGQVGDPSAIEKLETRKGLESARGNIEAIDAALETLRALPRSTGSTELERRKAVENAYFGMPLDAQDPSPYEAASSEQGRSGCLSIVAVACVGALASAACVLIT